MSDPLFREFVVQKLDAIKTILSNPDLSVDEIITAATEYKKLESRLQRIDNPVKRGKRTTTPAPNVVEENAA